MKKFLLLLFTASNCYAGIAGLTIHSRANCAGVNESISWHANNPHYLRTTSEHLDIKSGQKHFEDTGFQNTWRSAIVHWTEAVTGIWTVAGNHWEYFPKTGTTKFLGGEVVSSCTIYNGWWD